METLLLQDDLDKRQFEILENSILEKPEFVSSLNEIMQINDAANYIKSYDNFPSRKFEYSYALHAVDLTPNMIVADMGCSIDPFAPLLSKRTRFTYGFDIFSSHDEKWDPENGFRKGLLSGVKKMECYSKLIKDKLGLNVEYHAADMSSTHLPSTALDRIYCISVLEHLPKYKINFVLHEWRRILKQDGRIILTVDYIADNNVNFNIGKLINENGLELIGKVKLFPFKVNGRELVVAGFVLSSNSNTTKPMLFSSLYRKVKVLRRVVDILFSIKTKIISKLFN